MKEKEEKYLDSNENDNTRTTCLQRKEDTFKESGLCRKKRPLHHEEDITVQVYKNRRSRLPNSRQASSLEEKEERVIQFDKIQENSHDDAAALHTMCSKT